MGARVAPRMRSPLRRAFFAASILSAFAMAGCAAASPQGDEPESEVQGAELNENKALGMTDVTVLYPIPSNVDFFDDLLGPSSELDQGELLPPEIFAELATLPAPKMFDNNGAEVDPQRALFADWADAFSLLRVVGVRLDPCFGENHDLGGRGCAATIRLTAQFFQPRSVAGNRLIPDGRSAIHLFYEVSKQDFAALAKGMLELRKASGLPLQKGLITTADGVHPTLAAEGVRGPYATALKELLLKYAGERTLTQVAFCVQDRGAADQYYGGNREVNNRWVFGRHGYRDGHLRPLDIDTLDYVGLQTVDSAAANGRRDAVIVTPAITVRDNVLQQLNRRPEPDGTLDPAKMESARQAALVLQNPDRYTARTADCVSCHIAKQVLLNHAPDPLDFKSYTFRLDRTNDAIGPFRMFGYDSGARPILSARVVNETALVLEHVNKHVMR